MAEQKPDDDRVEFVTMFQPGHTDGYTHFYDGPLYESLDAANFASRERYDAYSVEAKARVCIRFKGSGQVYIADGPYKTFMDVEMEDKIRAAGLAKLSDAEKMVLGLK